METKLVGVVAGDKVGPAVQAGSCESEGAISELKVTRFVCQSTTAPRKRQAPRTKGHIRMEVAQLGNSKTSKKTCLLT
jgi:hypothetical protein